MRITVKQLKSLIREAVEDINSSVLKQWAESQGLEVGQYEFEDGNAVLAAMHPTSPDDPIAFVEGGNIYFNNPNTEMERVTPAELSGIVWDDEETWPQRDADAPYTGPESSSDY